MVGLRGSTATRHAFRGHHAVPQSPGNREFERSPSTAHPADLPLSRGQRTRDRSTHGNEAAVAVGCSRRVGRRFARRAASARIAASDDRSAGNGATCALRRTPLKDRKSPRETRRPREGAPRRIREPEETGAISSRGTTDGGGQRLGHPSRSTTGANDSHHHESATVSL